MNKMTISLKTLLICAAEFIIYATISIKTHSELKNPFCILPLICIIGQFVISVRAKDWKANMAVIIFIMGFFVKLYVYPLLVLLFGMGYYPSINATNKLGEAAFLQCYEYLSLVLFAIVYLRKHSNVKYYIKKNDIVKAEDMFYSAKYRRIIALLGIIAIAIMASYSALLYRFRYIYIFTQAETDAWYKNLENVSSAPLLIREFGFWLIELEKIMVVYLIIYFVKYRFRLIPDFIKIVVSLLMISSMVIITTNDRAGSFIAAFTMLLVLTKLYPKHGDLSMKLCIFLVSIVAMLVIFVFPIISGSNSNMYGSTSDPTYICRKLNAYFGCTANVSAALNMPKENLLAYFFGDFLGGIPMVQYLVKLPRSYMLFNSVLGVDIKSQITPAIGQGRLYFGYLLAPIVQIISFNVALKAQLRAYKANDTFSYFVYQYVAIFVSAGLTLYYTTLTMNLVLKYVFPMVVVVYIFHRGKRSEKSSYLYC